MQGYAFAGTRGIRIVEVSTDGGEHGSKLDSCPNYRRMHGCSGNIYGNHADLVTIVFSSVQLMVQGNDKPRPSKNHFQMEHLDYKKSS